MENQRKPFPIIMGVNLGIIGLVALSNSGSKDWLFVGGIMALGLVFLNGICGIISFVRDKDVYGKAFMLAAGLSLLISGGLCAVGLNV